MQKNHPPVLQHSFSLWCITNMGVLRVRSRVKQTKLQSQLNLLLSVDHDLVKYQFSYLEDGVKNGENNCFFPM